MFKSNGGFTLVELIVVVAILAILAGITIPTYAGYIEKTENVQQQINNHYTDVLGMANDALSKTDLGAIENELEAPAGGEQGGQGG